MERKKEQVRIRYWQQETAEFGRFVETEPMDIDIARELIEMRAYERAEMMWPDGFWDGIE